MTWEWVALISVISICATIFYVVSDRSPSNDQEKKNERMEKENIRDRISELEVAVLTLNAFASETKKFISEANLVKGLRSQR